MVAKAHGTAVLVGQLEVGGGAAGLEHPVMLSGRPTTVQCVPDTPPPARQAVGIDVVAVGSAIVDVLAETEDQVLGRLGLVKGTMALVDSASADRLYRAMGPAVEASGGSAANTVAGVASLGGSAAFIGRVRDDQLGAVFAHDLRAAGVRFTTPAATSGPATARCLIFVTPDGERTMNTHLGAAACLEPEDIDAGLIADSRLVYLEGYLWDPPQAKQALRRTVALARETGAEVALTLSDPFCVERHREEFLELIDSGVVTDVNSDYRPGMPEVRVTPDRDKAAALNIPIQRLAYTLIVATGGQRNGRFTERDKRYDVRLRYKDLDSISTGVTGSVGTAATRRQVYGSRGLPNTSPAGPVSTISPSFITATR